MCPALIGKLAFRDFTRFDTVFEPPFSAAVQMVILIILPTPTNGNQRIGLQGNIKSYLIPSRTGLTLSAKAYHKIKIKQPSLPKGVKSVCA